MFELIDRPARGKTCEAIIGLVDEGKEVMEGFKGCDALDAGLIAGAQSVEHYEISGYRTLITWAKTLGQKEAADLLSQTLAEEETTDKVLTKLAVSSVNAMAA